MAWSDVASDLSSLIGNAVQKVTRLAFPAQALAEPAPALYDGWFYGQDQIQLIDHTVSYATLYKSQPAVSAVVNKRAELLSTLPVKIWNCKPDNGNIEVVGDDLWNLLRDPTHGEMPRWSFWRWFCATKDIYGEAFALKIRDDQNNVIALKPITPIRTAAKREDNGDVFYSFTLSVGDAGILTVPASEVVAWMTYNPSNVMRGVSPLEPLRTTLANEDAQRRSMIAFWKRGARPGTVIKHPQTLSPQALEKIRSQYDTHHGGPEGTGSTAVLDEGMELQIVQLTAEEAQYSESRKLNINEVCMVYDMPPAAIHALLEKASFSSSVEQLRSLGRDTMPPICESLSSALDSQLLPDFYNDQFHQIEFSLGEMLRGDWETLAERMPGLVQGGVMTPAQGAQAMGLPLPDDPAAFRLYANQATQPLGQPSLRETITEAATGVGALDQISNSRNPGVAPNAPEQPQPQPAQPAATTPPKPPAGAGKSMDRVQGISGRIRTKAARPQMLAQSKKAMRKAVGNGMGRQAVAIKQTVNSPKFAVPVDADPDDIANGIYDPDDWDDDLEGELSDPSTAVVDAFGKKTGGSKFDVGKAAAFIAADVAIAAKAMNSTTASQISDAVTKALDSSNSVTDRVQAVQDAISGVTDLMTGARADQAAETRTNSLANFGEHEGAKQSGMSTKTWNTGANPRDSHAAMDGETVGLDEQFSNGARWPGDMKNLDENEVAGCNCTLEFGSDGSDDSDSE